MLKRDAVEAELAKIVEEFGENYTPFVRCSYGDGDGAPSCIVGHLLYRLEPKTFRTVVETSNFDAFHVLADRGGIVEVEDDELRMELREVQYLQDSGVSWGKAVKMGFGNADV